MTPLEKLTVQRQEQYEEQLRTLIQVAWTLVHEMPDGQTKKSLQERMRPLMERR